MAESHLDQKKEAKIDAPTMEEPCVWEKLPRELQDKVLCHLPLRTLFQVRCVCKAWRYCIVRRPFTTMYDVMHNSVPARAALVYTHFRSTPNSIKWSMYDFAQNTWQQMTTLPPHSHPSLGQARTFYDVFPVGGLLVFRIWKGGVEWTLPIHGVNLWVVWNPLTDKWKALPPCENMTPRATSVFVHAFVADESTQRYKILMAHNPMTLGRGKSDKCIMVTELYDSATGVWAQSQSPLQDYLNATFHPPGVLSNGVIYFVSRWFFGRNRGKPVLLEYNIKSDEWHEEVLLHEFEKIFEWDGHLMVAVWLFWHEHSGVRERIVREWDVGTRRWVDTGIRVPQVVIDREFEERTFVAQGNHLVVGEIRGHFRSATYRKAEDCWTWVPQICGPFPRQEMGGWHLLLFKPRLDWTP